MDRFRGEDIQHESGLALNPEVASHEPGPKINGILSENGPQRSLSVFAGPPVPQ